MVASVFTLCQKLPVLLALPHHKTGSHLSRPIPIGHLCWSVVPLGAEARGQGREDVIQSSFEVAELGIFSYILPIHLSSQGKMASSSRRLLSSHLREASLLRLAKDGCSHRNFLGEEWPFSTEKSSRAEPLGS